MDEKSISVCQYCGSVCENCAKNAGIWMHPEIVENGSDILHLHQEIESLKQELLQRDGYILQVETNVLNQAQQFPNGEYEHLKQELLSWKDKYRRLYDNHKKLQKVNQSLEDKLLLLVDKFETEKGSLTRDIADLTTRLVEARLSITDLEEQNELYRSDCNIAIQLLQCKPSNFVDHKLSSFPSDVQDKVRLHFSDKPPRRNLHNSSSSPELRMIRVPIPTFPPTAMVYSVNSVPSPQEPDSYSASNETDYVSAAIMAKVLEERTKERVRKKEHCRICLYRRHSAEFRDKETQTRRPSSNVSCLLNGVQTVKVHRQRSDSNSSTETQSQRVRNGSLSSTETTI